MSDLSRTTLGSYQVLSEIGRGGMAVVYKAYQPAFQRKVALKLINQALAAQSGFAARFEQEARVIASLEHPHILPVYDYGREGKHTYLVMRLIESGTLEDLIRGKGRLEPAQAARILSQTASALDHAHARGIIHRDLKPSNIMLDPAGNAYLTDFGIAKVLQSNLNLTTGTGIIGTPAYMSPEQITGQPLDGRSDVYSLGVVLFEMLAGKQPFTGDTPISVLVKRISEDAPPLRTAVPEIPPAVEAVVLRALTRDPAERFPSAGGLAAAFDAAVRGLTTVAPTPRLSTLASGPDPLRVTGPAPPTRFPAGAPPPSPTGGAPPAGRRPGVFLIGGLALIGLLALMAVAGVIGLATGLIPSAMSPAPTATAPVVAAPASTTQSEASPEPGASQTAETAPTLQPTPRAAAVPPAGRVVFGAAARPGDTVTVEVDALPAAPPGKAHLAWFSGPEGVLLLGALTPDADGTGRLQFTDPSGGPLYTRFSAASITLEEAAGPPPAAPSAQVEFAGEWSQGSSQLLGLLLVADPDRPLRVSTVAGVLQEAKVMGDHLGLMLSAASAGDRAGVLVHGEHVINILEGQNGAAFGDYNDNGRAENPGDGYGLLHYVGDLRERALALAAQNPDDLTLVNAANLLALNLENLTRELTDLRDLTVRIVTQDTLDSARPFVDQVPAKQTALFNGADSNNDSRIDLASGEAGLAAAADFAGQLPTLDLFPAAPG
ncbi:MAG: protein kinase [Chloroflexi bacterium]|nr:protein kinase [Chloroflexota bacterium]